MNDANEAKRDNRGDAVLQYAIPKGWRWSWLFFCTGMVLMWVGVITHVLSWEPGGSQQTEAVVPLWVLAFVLVDVYVWLRLVEGQRRLDVTRVVAGTGTTGILASGMLMITMWRPPLYTLTAVASVSLVVALIGMLMRVLKQAP